MDTSFQDVLLMRGGGAGLRAAIAAMRHFAEAEEIRPPANDESILRWNRCVRLLESLPGVEQLDELYFDGGDSPPVSIGTVPRRVRAR